MTQESTRRSLSLAAATGALGGAVLVLSHRFFVSGKYILIPYALVVLGILAAVRSERIARFRDRFIGAFGAFMLASLALYLEVLFAAHRAGPPSIGVFGHAWRLGFVGLVGAAVSLAVARLSRSAFETQAPA